MYKDMISVTDEILFELYKIENRSLAIEVLTINNELYLVNKRGVKYKFDLGLITKIPKEMLDKHSIDEILIGCYDHDPTYQDIMSKLTFTPEEMFIMNILLSNYLNTDSRIIPEICFRDIDYYRQKGSFNKNIVVPKENAESYIEIINSLCNKMIYLKTSQKFRKRYKKDYGVADRNFYQNLLKISNPYLASSNNLSFKYTFEEFGEVIRLSKRWGNVVPNRCFHYRLNQAINNVIAGEIARQVFVAQDDNCKLTHSNYSEDEFFLELSFTLNVDYFFEFIEGETMKKMRGRRKNFNRKLESILTAFVKEKKIDRYEILDDDFYHGKSSKVEIFLNKPTLNRL